MTSIANGEDGLSVRTKLNNVLERYDQDGFANVAALLADTTLTYSTASAGDIVRTRSEGFSYQVAASGATNHHVTTAGGVKLYVVPGDAGYNVKAFGAVGNGAANDTAALVAAEAAAFAAGGELCSPTMTCLVTSTIQLRVGGDLEQMTIVANGTSVSPVVRFGTTSGLPTSYKSITLPRVRNTARASGVWGAGIGIELANVDTCDFFIPSATEFEIGVTCGGHNNGFAYNTVRLGFIYSNKVNLRLQPAASGGWSNQNVFIGGRLGINTSDFTTSGYVGTRNIVLAKGPASAGGPNNNTFLNVSVETDLLEYMVEFNESAFYNQFINCRYEGSANKILWQTNTAGGISDNAFFGGYSVESLTHTFSGTGSSVYNNVLGARSNSVDASGYAFNISNRSSAAESSPHIQGFAPAVNAISRDQTATDWTYRLFANGLSGKRSTDAAARATLDFQNGRLNVGDGTSSPANYIGEVGSLVGTNSSFIPSTDNAIDLGLLSLRWSNAYARQIRPGAGAVIWTSGAGTPEGAVTAPVGSLFTRTDGGAGTTLYVKESGTGNTGWIGK